MDFHFVLGFMLIPIWVLWGLLSVSSDLPASLPSALIYHPLFSSLRVSFPFEIYMSSGAS